MFVFCRRLMKIKQEYVVRFGVRVQLDYRLVMVRLNSNFLHRLKVQYQYKGLLFSI